DKSPSDLGNVSSFLFTPDIFNYLDEALAQMDESGELYYNDALRLMLEDGKRVLAVEIKGGRFHDTGNKLQYLKTVVEFGLKHPDINGEFREFLRKLEL